MSDHHAAGDDRKPASDHLSITLLGTGTSTGIPVPTCTCEVCQSSDPRDKRLRCSCVVEINGMSVLIDVGPDFRAQALRHDLKRVDAVLITHEHFDHVAGLDDLRAYMLWNRTTLPVFASPRSAAELRRRYDYIFVDGSYPGVPKLQLIEIEDKFRVKSRYGTDESVDVACVEVQHGALSITGYRIGRFAYLTDASRLSEASVRGLRGVDTVVLSALRHEPHPTHFTLDEAVEAARLIGARKAYFIHMTHSILHERDGAALPAGFELGYDGLVMEVGQ